MNPEKTSYSEIIPGDPPTINRGALIMIASVCCFTANTLLLKYLGTARTISPAVAMLFRASVGALIVFAFFRSRSRLKLKPIFRDRSLIARGITGVFGTAAYYYTVPTLGAGKATILCNTYVLFAVIIASIMIGESLRKAQFAWIALAFAGIVLLIGKGSATVGPSQRPPGIDETISILGALCAASTVVLIRSLTRRFSNGTIFMTQCLWVGIAVFPFAIPYLKTINVYDAFFLVGAGAMAACGQLLLNEGFRRLTVAVGSSIQMTWPLMTALGGFFFFGEIFTPGQLLGSALILIGIYFIRSR